LWFATQASVPEEKLERGLCVCTVPHFESLIPIVPMDQSSPSTVNNALVEAPRQEEDDFGAHCCELPLFAALSFFQDLDHGGGSNYSDGSVLFQAEESPVARH